MFRRQSIPLIEKIGQSEDTISEALGRNVTHAMTVARQAGFAFCSCPKGGRQGRNGRRSLIAGIIIEAGKVMKGHEKECHDHQQGKHATPALRNNRKNEIPVGAGEGIPHACREVIQIGSVFKPHGNSAQIRKSRPDVEPMDHPESGAAVWASVAGVTT